MCSPEQATRSFRRRGEHRRNMDENAEVEACITKRIIHISQASTTEVFGTTMEASSTEEYAEQDTTLEPTSADPNTTLDTSTKV